MKRLILLVMVFPFISFSFASEPKEGLTRFFRHEVNVSIGAMILPHSQWFTYKDGIVDAFQVYTNDGMGLTFEDVSTGFHLSYFYHFSPQVAIGFLTAFTSTNRDFGYRLEKVQMPSGTAWNSERNRWETGYEYESMSKPVDARIKAMSTFFVPTFKWSCMNCRWCSLYMKFAAGIHYQQFRFESDEFPKEEVCKHNENKLWLAYMITPFGWEIGHKKIRYFMEFGIGSNTNFQTGLTYRFGSY